MDNLTLKKLSEELKPIYSDLLNAVNKIQHFPIATFCTQWGKDWVKDSNSGIAFYGRATNGWITESLNINELFDGPNPVFNRKDQMQWVKDYWNTPNNNNYKCCKSSFWRVIKQVSENFYPNNWESNIVWSNLCKIAPWEKGNPNRILYKAQLNYSQMIMEKEIEILGPKHIVIFTGQFWAHDYIKYLNNNIEPEPIKYESWSNNKYCIKVYLFGKRYFYLTEHPQGKPEKEHAKKLIELINQNNQQAYS